MSMRLHPALFMLMVWGGCVFLYTVLPFQLIDKSLSFHGNMTFVIFLFSFCFGSLLVPQQGRYTYIMEFPNVKFNKADRVLKLISLIAVFACFMDMDGKSVGDLGSAYLERSDRAGALLRGEASGSSIWFQVAFLTYPAGFVYLVRQIIFSPSIQIINFSLFGLLPIVMAMLSMGGRAPLLYAILLCFFAFMARRSLFKHVRPYKKRRPMLKLFLFFLIVLLVSAAFFYFSAVFFVRAEIAGGAAEMLLLAEKLWGIGFHGDNFEILNSILGDNGTYLVFVFSWYLIQGFFMQNFIYSDYEGPLQLGIYGVDLVSALMRRLNGELIANNFDSLMDLGVYGFFPSAFGSLYVDFGYFGFMLCALWGFFTSLVYKKLRVNKDVTWYLLAPFITMGILFSLINTPIGFTNGLVTHIWLLLAFFLARHIETNQSSSK